MNVPLFFGLVGLLGCLYLWIGRMASKDLQSSEDYFLMGRNLTYFPLSFTLLATQLGGGTLLGAAQEAYEKGWVVLIYPLGTCLGLCILGCGFGGKLRSLNITTVAEIFEKIYGSRNQRSIASGLSIAALFFILVAQGMAARMFFAAMGVEGPVIFIIFWCVLVAYTVMGGLQAVVNTDILQALFIIATLCFAYFSMDLTNLSPGNFSVTEGVGVGEVPWTTWFFMPLLFMLIEQDMGQRCFAAKSSRVISFSAITAGLILLCCSTIAIYFGVLAREVGITVEGNSSILIESVTVLTNPVVTTFFMAAIFMAVISTADSLLCSISSNLSCDFVNSGNRTDKQKMKLSKCLTLLVGVSALGFVYLFDSVVGMLMLSYELSVCILFVPIMGAIISNTPSRLGAWLSMLFGAIGFLTFRYVDFVLPREILTISLSFAGYLIGLKLGSNAYRQVEGAEI
jgi:solute:Na+ symporter, SSS family